MSHAFDCDEEDPLHDDLIVNSSWCPIDELADVVVRMCRKRWPHQERDA